MLGGTTYAGGDEKVKQRRQSKFKSRSKVSEKALLVQLKIIEEQLSEKPEENIKKLDLIVKQAIQHDHYTAKIKAYWLMSKVYKNLQQGELALKFMNLALEKKEQIAPKKLKKVEIEEDMEEEIATNETSVNLKSTSNNEQKKTVVKSNEPSAIEDYFQEDELVSTAGSSSEAAWSNGNSLPNAHKKDMAEIQILLGDYELSNTYFKQYQTKLNADQKREIDYKIAQNLYADKKYKEAMTLYELLAKDEKDEDKIALCNSRIAGCKISLGDTEEGIALYQNSISNTSFEASPEQVESKKYKEFEKNKEVVTKALREQKKFEEEVNLRSEVAKITQDKLEFLKLAQGYYKVKKFKQAEDALDTFLKDPSYEMIDQEEVEVLKLMSSKLNKNGKSKKAYNYLYQYENISDSIQVSVQQITGYNSRIGALGVQNVVDLKILQKDKEISDNMISHLVNEQELQEEALGFQKTIIYLLSFLIVVSLGTTLYIIRVSKQRRIANQQLAIRSLRSQMNPHFIFNALNSINSFISMNDERSANKFLTEFSTLMRSVMENSEHDFISLAKELEIIELYLGLEHYRFKDKFTYKLEVDECLDEDEMQLPPMLVQPYIENAIWHGLRYKESAGELVVSFNKQNGNLQIIVQDNGIGRKKSHELKTKNQKKNKSTAIKNIDQRIKLISALHNIKVKVDIQDLDTDGSGTKITLTISQLNKLS